MPVQNIFTNIQDHLPAELTQTLTQSENVKIERIISKGHSSPDGFWYGQEQNEFVILLKGKARLLFKKNNEPVVLNPGDYLNIPAHVEHRVEWTAQDQETVWLAVFY